MKKKRPPIKTKIEDIIDYWEGIIYEGDLSVDWAEAHERCWRCGYKRSLQRCHIIPDSLGGKDSPENLVLLCSQCHKEAPNVQDSKFMWDWIKASAVPFYDTFWVEKALEEYQRIYHKSYLQELSDRNLIFPHGLEQFQSLKIGEISYHFGDPYVNLSSFVGILRMKLEAFDKKCKSNTMIAKTRSNNSN